MGKKISALFFCLLILTSSCEKDDFCIQNPVTPQLILRFYNSTDKISLKTVDNLYVWADGKDSLYINESTDSLAIPLNSGSNQTIYNLSKGDIVNRFTIDYTPRDEYVSRSCGFKVVFENVSISSNNTWIQEFTPNTLTAIENENQAHVQIFH